MPIFKLEIAAKITIALPLNTDDPIALHIESDNKTYGPVDILQIGMAQLSEEMDDLQKCAYHAARRKSILDSANERFPEAKLVQVIVDLERDRNRLKEEIVGLREELLICRGEEGETLPPICVMEVEGWDDYPLGRIIACPVHVPGHTIGNILTSPNKAIALENSAKLPAPAGQSDKFTNDELLGELRQSLNTIEFLYGCLQTPGFQHAHPEQTREIIIFLQKMLPSRSFCVHSRTHQDCESCLEGYRLRVLHQSVLAKLAASPAPPEGE